MNTANKRASAILHMLPFRGRFPIPSGTVERQQPAYAYSGIAASAPPTPPSVTSRMSNIYLYPRGL